MIPCKTCIALAICRHKEAIECNQLYNWNIRPNKKSRMTEVRKTLKNVNIITIIEDGRKMSVIYTGPRKHES